MKLIHLSDLHLGKRVNEFSMMEDQKYILEEILKITLEERPEGVIIAGDVYDRPVPPAEAVELFDEFLFRLSEQRLKVFIISGNHDSPERLAFGSRLISGSGVYLAPVYTGRVEPVVLRDEYGPVKIFLLPFLKPVHVKRCFPEEEIGSYTDALQKAVEELPLCPKERNVLVTHQFVAGAGRCDSEELSLGGSDAVDVSVFDPFDYVALGHLHNPQKAGKETVRYCGTPLKYSFSEAAHGKSVTVVELGEKGSVSVRTVPLHPLHDMKEIRGSYEALILRDYYEGKAWREDYLHITLTDEEDIPDAVRKLQVIYPNLMKLDYDNRRTRTRSELIRETEAEKKTPLELLEEFYEKQNNQAMSETQRAFASELIEKIWGGDGI